MEKLFNLQKHGTTVPRELLAGLITFLTMAYILTLNPRLLGEIRGLTPGAVFTATAIASAIATLCMAFIANLPIALAPAMGLNAFFTYIVVYKMGYSWQLALTAVFMEGIIFIIISIFNVREAIAAAIPFTLKKAITVGIGLYLAYVGFEKTGMITHGEGVILGLGKLADPGVFLAFIGLVLIIILHSLNVPGAIFIGIMVTTILGVPMGITPKPAADWKPFSMPEMFPRFRFDFTLSSILNFKFFTVFFTFLFVDIFDTIGVLVGVTTQAGLIEKDGTIPRLKQAFLADAVGTVAGAALGTTTVTSRVESTAGVAAGGRTGLTALSTGLLFLLALFFWPVFRLIPSAATYPALIFVGFIMMAPVVEINFKDPTEGIPAFMAILMMPFAYSTANIVVYSLANGIVYGILSYVILKVVTRRIKEINSVTWLLFVVFILKFLLEGGLKIMLKIK
jgi:AGZA family xanthine/uracil permease-like MFS transporter